MRKFLLWCTTKMQPPRVIHDRAAAEPYLSRWYLIGKPPVIDKLGNPTFRARLQWVPQLYLHRFHRSDGDHELHNHPWKWSIAIILSGGYSEEHRTADNHVERRIFVPGDVNLIKQNDYHRVDLLGEDSWSLFIAGPRCDTWFFWDRTTHKCAHWKALLEWKQGARSHVSWKKDNRDLVQAYEAALWADRIRVVRWAASIVVLSTVVLSAMVYALFC